MKMQQISLDEAIKLIDGNFYDISPDRDFSSILLNSQPLSEASSASVIEDINRLEHEQAELSRFVSWIFAPVKSNKKSKKTKPKEKQALKNIKKILRGFDIY